MSYEHQDLKTIVFTKKPTPKKQIQIDPTYKKMKQLEENNGETPIKLLTVSDEDKKIIQSLRLQKKFTQDDLNKKLALKKDTIKEIENGKHPKNIQLTNKIKKFLTEYQLAV